MKTGTVTDARTSPHAFASTMIVSRKILHEVLRLAHVSPADIVESRETCRLIIEAMTPDETIIAACRLHGLPDRVPASLLGITQPTASKIMDGLKGRLIDQYPELRLTLEGRSRPSGPQPSQPTP